MNPIFSLKNFRSFGEEGADFELAPITVLTGCNSAGKSSLVKALMLLAKNTKSEGWFGFGGHRFFPSIDLKASSVDLKLGGYNKIVNALNKDGDIELNYTIWSSFLHEEVACRRTYQVKKTVLNDGVLKSFLVERKDGTIIYKGTPVKRPFMTENGVAYCDDIQEEEHFDAISENFERFLLAYGYVYFVDLKRKMDTLNKPNNATFKLITDKIENGIEKMNRYGMTVKEAEQYDMSAILKWHQTIVSGNDDEITKAFINDLDDKEKEELRREMYFNCVVNEIVSPWFFNELAFIDSSTNKINRVYNVDDKDKLSALLCDIVSRTENFRYHSGEFVNEWLRLFNIGDFLEIEGTDECLGVRVFVQSGETRRLLADEGCGLTQIISILLQIDAIKNRNISTDFDSDDIAQFNKFIICVEEPEVHLHPKFQSMLADLFVEAYQKYNIHFIVETHSEYLIRKLQVLVADKENALVPNDISLNYVEKDESGVSTNRKIELAEDGRLMDSFGEGFFDEAGGLSRQLLKLSF